MSFLTKVFGNRYAKSAIGGALNALPGYSSLGANITNPKVNYQGNLNSARPSNKPTVNVAPYQSPLSYSSSISGAGGGGADVGSAALQNEVRNRIQAIQGAYQSLLGNYDRVANDQVNQYNQNYNTQIKGLNDSYGAATNQTQGVYGSKGLGDSSFLGNALDEGKNTYNTNLDSINQDRTSKLAQIGQYVGGQKAQANAAMQQYNQYLPQIGQYSGSDLNSLNSQLGQALPGIQAQSAGLGTNQDYINQLQQYAPAVNQGASQLQSKLQQLIASNTPQSAKNTIGQGLIKSTSGADPAYYNDYFAKLLAGQGA